MLSPIAQPRPRYDVPLHGARTARRAFTLGELVVSLGLVSVLLLAMGSVMVVSGRAVGVSAAHAGEAKVDDAIAALAAEHRLALSILERTPTAITFTVPDRDGDLAVETIRYAWSGIAGDPLTRQYNGAVPEVVLRDVRSFQLSYIEKTVAPLPVAEQESPEELFLAHAPDPVTPSPNPNFNVTVSTNLSSTWLAQYFKPTFPADKTVVSWKVTRVRFRPARTVGNTSTAYWNCQIRAASDARQPTGGAINGESVRRGMAGLAAGTAGTTNTLPPQVEVVFANATGLDPAKGACFVVSAPLLTATGVVATERNGPTMTPNTHFLTSSTSGLTWSAVTDTQDMYIEVYGTYRYLQPQ